MTASARAAGLATRAVDPSIAVVGMACRYPDARTPDELWRNVLAQRRAFRRIPAERLRLEDYLSADRADSDSIYSAFAAVIEGYEFDRARYRVAGPAYRAADLAHWLALDVAADALADAGFATGQQLPRETTGVIVGNTLTGEFSRANTLRLRWPYVRRVVDAALSERGMDPAGRSELLQALETRYKAPFPEVGEETLAGGLSNTIAGRICNHFDFKGGGYTVDGACASSLLAVATACSSLVAHDLDMALAGGVDLSLDPFELVGFSRTGALAPELMRVYDARSAGFWPGEGCGFVVLMRAADALAQGRRIYAMIRGWGVASDGSGGITRPEVEGQLLAIRRAYARAGYGADTVCYFEGHGTGTSVGDAVELEALSRARREAAADAPAATIGSIKANIGHTKAAAGVAGLLKSVLAVHHQIQPATTGSFEPHPSLEGSALRVTRSAVPWPQGEPLRASVSAMGFGGIDTHLTLEGVAANRRSGLAPDEESLGTTPQDAELFLFGAATVVSLREQIARVRAYAANLSFAEMADLAAALERLLPASAAARAAVVAGTPVELEARLSALLSALLDDGGANAAPRIDARGGVFFGSGHTAPRLGFLFPGQGSPTHVDGGLWVRRFGFAGELYRAARLSSFGDPRSTAAAQPAIVTASLVGLRALETLGIEAVATVGHSLGELTAWHWAGALDDASLLRLAAVRGKAMAELAGPEGAMASLATGAAEAEPLIEGTGVVIAGLNHTRQTVISGEAQAVRAVLERARRAGIAAVKLPVSHAFHSPLVAGTAPALESHVTLEPFRPLERTVFSTISGAALDRATDLRARLLEQLTSPVRFTEALRLAGAEVDLWLEVGPGQTLSGLAAEQSAAPAIALDAGGPSVAGWLRAAGAAWALGAPLRHSALFEGRFVKPFELEWRPRFFANPCEQAPLSGDTPPVTRVARELPAAANGSDATAPATAAAERSALEIVRELVAARAELPGHAVEDGHRLLGDLHLNSIVVGQLAISAAVQLGMPAPVDATAYAGATVAELAHALESLHLTQGSPAPVAAPAAPEGVDAWVRAFAKRWVRTDGPGRATATGAGGWRVFAAPGDPLAREIGRELERRGSGSGVVVCLPRDPGEAQIELLLDATRSLWPERSTARFVVVQHDGGGGGFARSLYLESPDTVTCVVDVPQHEALAAGWVADEALGAFGFHEVRYDRDGSRNEPILAPLLDGTSAPLPLGPTDVLLVTGGGKGIAAECALALARERGVRLGLIGRASPAADSVLAANLARLADAGVTFHYAAADVCDAAQLDAALREVESRLGPVTAVLHGAGANTPRPLSALEPADFRATVGPKLAGARNLAALLDPSRLKLFVAVGSIIARTGLRGEADYAAANEWLAAWVRGFQAAHPRCRCRVVEWSVWSGVGMGERLGRIDALEREGIAPIPPDLGVRSLLKAIDDELADPVVVVAGRFGAPPTVRLAEYQLPLLRFLEHPRVHYPGIELVCDSELSPVSDPYLVDHAFHGELLLPAVMCLEAMAQAAQALTGQSGSVSFEHVTFARPVIAPRDGTETLRVAALVREDGAVDLVLRCSTTRFQADHAGARCRIVRSAAPDLGREVAPTHSGELAPTHSRELALAGDHLLDGLLALDPDRDLYGPVLFQAGRFQRLSGYRWLRATECMAEICGGGTAAWFGPYLPPALLLGDPGGRDAALHAVQACIPHRALLPIAVERIECASLPSAQPVVVRARERSRSGDTFVYDLTIGEPSGRVLERWTGLELRAMTASPALATWPESLLAAYLERRLEELLPGADLRVATDGRPAAAGSERAIQAGLAGPMRVHHRPDGKPEVATAPERAVSAAHADAMILAVTGPGAVGCDVEPIVARPDEQWRGLLGEPRFTLANLVALEAREPRDAAFTRVWAAMESLKKSGLATQTPLSLSRVTADGWVLLSAGAASVATFVATTHRSAVPLAFAILSGNTHASV